VRRVGWLDCSSGVSGDMLLGALTELDAVKVTDVAHLLGVKGWFAAGASQRGGIRATRVEVQPAGDQPHRRLSDIEQVIDKAGLPAPAAQRAIAVFRRLAAAESKVHGVPPHDVAFHEVGAVDAIVDIVGTCIGLHALNLDALIVGPIALGGGHVNTAHGVLPVPGPAVLELLTDSLLVARGGPADHELATPTGVALLAELATTSGPMPAMRVERVGVGAGSRELEEQPNVLRFLVGEQLQPAPAHDDWQVLAANVDDLDPRLWPVVIERLMATGAADAWLTPIVMKKGRPAHTISVLCDAATADAASRVLFTETSTIGVRTSPVGKHALDREWLTIDVDGQPVRVKVARLSGAVVNVSPEFDDAVRAATALGRPVKSVLAAASAAAHSQLP
jgi:uncharacterized protein (TIGR00299 family) protein